MPAVTYPHRIRLRGPWDCTPLDWLVRLDDGQIAALDSILPDSQRVTMPCRWRDVGWGQFTGKILCVRRFGRPSRLDDFERVWLTCAGVSDSAEVWLNDRRLGEVTGGPAEFPLTQEELLERNELKVLVTSFNADGGLWGEVALEIRAVSG